MSAHRHDVVDVGTGRGTGGALAPILPLAQLGRP
jgi:hypothetical protein